MAVVPRSHLGFYPQGFVKTCPVIQLFDFHETLTAQLVSGATPTGILRAAQAIDMIGFQ
jgi:hypothetical protein